MFLYVYSLDERPKLSAILTQRAVLFPGQIPYAGHSKYGISNIIDTGNQKNEDFIVLLEQYCCLLTPIKLVTYNLDEDNGILDDVFHITTMPQCLFTKLDMMAHLEHLYDGPMLSFKWSSLIGQRYHNHSQTAHSNFVDLVVQKHGSVSHCFFVFFFPL